MNKKIITAVLSPLILISNAALAAEYEAAGPIRINNREIFCETNKPVLINDRTFIPVDKLMAYGGINAKFIEKNNQIVIDSKDNLKRISLYPGDPIMQIYTYKTLLIADREDIELETAPQIIDDVPMFPLRPVAEALGLELTWDEKTQTVFLDTVPDEPVSENRSVLSLEADRTDVNAGDIVNLTIKVSNIEQYNDYNLTSVTGSIEYDPEKFEYVETKYVPGTDCTVMISAENKSFNDYAAKSLAVINNCTINQSELNAMTMSFIALTDDGGEFSLSDRFNLLRGADNEIIMSGPEKKNVSLSSDSTLIINTVPVTIK